MRINKAFALAAIASAILGHASTKPAIVEQPVSVAKCQRAEGCPMGEEYRRLQEQQRREDQKKNEEQTERQGETQTSNKWSLLCPASRRIHAVSGGGRKDVRITEDEKEPSHGTYENIRKRLLNV